MVEGFWVLYFETPQFTGGGVAMLLNGRIFGGDDGFTWIGTYTGDERLFKGRVMVRNFNPSVQSIFGIGGDYEMHISCNVDGDQISGTAMVAGQPQNTVGLRMLKKANL